jgi:small subunit ribosomal protein S16
MLKIRLQRVGRKNIAAFRVVLTDSKNSSKSGKCHEVLGSHNPVSHKIVFDEARVKYWIEKGAQPSDSVNNFLIERGLIKGRKRNVLSVRNPKIKSKGTEKEEQKAPAGGATDNSASQPTTPAPAA